MTVVVVVIIPVLARPHRAALVVESLAASVRNVPCRPVFVCTPGDDDQIQACYRTHADVLITGWSAGPGDFAKKTNLAARASSEPWLFAGADDLRFHPGWADEAIRVADVYGAGMVGTDDLGNGLVRQGRHSTHSLFRREYVEECGTVDEPGLVYHEGYDHQSVDVEAYETAVARGCFAFAAEARVEHLHPFWGKSSRDATYEKALAHGDADRDLLARRRRLWQAVAA